MLILLTVPLLLIISSAYELKSTHLYPDEYQLISIAIAPANITNKNGDTTNMVLGTKSGSMIFANAFNSSVRFIYNRQATTAIRYLGWNRGGVISAATRTVVILDPVSLERIGYISLGPYAEIDTISHVYRQKQKVILLAIQCRNYQFADKIYIYENQVRIMQLNKSSTIVPVQFDLAGDNLYYFDNQNKKKYTVDILNRRITKQQYYLGKHVGLAMSNKREYPQIAVTLSEKGDIFIWQNDPTNKYTVITPSTPQSRLAFTTNSSNLLTYGGNVLKIWKTVFGDYQNWRIVQEINVGAVVGMDAGQGLIVFLESRNKINVYYKYEAEPEYGEFTLFGFLCLICLCSYICIYKRYKQAKLLQQQRHDIEITSTSNFDASSTASKDHPYPLNQQSIQDHNNNKQNSPNKSEEYKERGDQNRQDKQ